MLLARIELALKVGQVNALPVLNIDSDQEKSITVEVQEARAELSYAIDGGAQSWLALSVGHSPLDAMPSLTVERESSIDLVFPLESKLVARVERMRKGRRPTFKIQVKFFGQVKYNVSVNSRSSYEQKATLENRERMLTVPAMWVWKSDMNSIVLDVPRDDWAEQVLPQLELGAWEVFEIPIIASEPIPAIDEYLRDAEHQLRLGNDKRCIGACRDAIDAMKELLQKVANPVIGDDRASAADKSKRLAEAYSSLIERSLDLASAESSFFAVGAHHRPLDVPVERADAEFALSASMTLRRYLGIRLLATTKGEAKT